MYFIPVLVLAPGPGLVFHVYVHIRTIRLPWIQVRCQSCQVDCIRQFDLYMMCFCTSLHVIVVLENIDYTQSCS
ncbi:hypothetical protein C1H46_041227 [Malus baccata]|uniref:Uncharacterized protein n=1 Tax=Malus baccata TaxID=106549 RepID=A0A540KGA1_MALBA|nr:hypothetical protein C1H46_041227 [Malus baccata]